VRPKANVQVGWGLIASAIALIALAVLSFVPDPFFRQRVLTTTFDNVDGVTAGVPVYFRGAPLGAVRSVRLDPRRRTFAVRLGVERDWRASGCVFTQVSAANPFTTPRIELVALEIAPSACPAARLAAHCLPTPPARDAIGARGVVGCERQPDLLESASFAVAQAAAAAKSVNLIAQRIQVMMQGSGAAKLDVPRLVGDATTTLASVNDLTRRLDDTLAPGKGDAALTLGNVRRASERAASLDVASLNTTLAQVKTLVSQNQANVTAMLSQGSAVTAQTRELLENLSGSLTTASANLQRTTDNLDALTERLAADPTYVVRGQRFVDPPKEVQPK